MGYFRLIFIFVLLMAGWPGDLLAQGEKKKCDQAAQQAEQQCTQAKNGAEAAGQNHNQSGTAQDQAHGGQSDRGSNNLCPRIQDQQKNLEGAKGTCEAAKAQCKSTCQQEQQKDQQHDTQFKQSQGQQGHPKEGADPSVCERNLPQMISSLGQAIAPLAGQAAQACNSGDQAKSDGKPPQIPPIQPPQKKDDKKDEQNQQAKTAEALKCDSSEGVRYSDCNGYYTSKCMANMSAGNCSEFSQRYCGSAKSGQQTDIAIENFAKAQSTGFRSASVVVDKGGEGLGSGYCATYSAYKFCQASGKNECPSCRGTHGYDSTACQNDPSKCIPSLSDDQLLNAKNKCPTDPVFLDPTVQKRVSELASGETKKEPGAATAKPESVPKGLAAGGPGGGGIGLGGSSGGGSGGGGSIIGATPESIPIGRAASFETGSGAGGGGGYGSQSVEQEDPMDPQRHPTGGLTEKAVMPAGSVEGMAADISNQYGPNVFSISTTIYKAWCGRGDLAHCKETGSTKKVSTIGRPLTSGRYSRVPAHPKKLRRSKSR